MAKFFTHSEDETVRLGRDFAVKSLKIGDVVALHGELGTGKTRFVKGICQGLGVQEHVASPTFTIVNEYHFPGGKLFHFDFYRVNSVAEILDIGFEEYLHREGICVIEWVDRAKDVLPDSRIDVWFSLGKKENEREISIEQTVGVRS